MTKSRPAAAPRAVSALCFLVAAGLAPGGLPHADGADPEPAAPAAKVDAATATVEVAAPMPPPAWALLERALLRSTARACEEYFDRYFDDRGYLECVERWGGDDGPDDAIENLSDWPTLHALGAPDSVLRLYKKGWEGHLRQYTAARTTDVPMGRLGMYFKEYPVMFDWLHLGEGLTPFNLQGLSDPDDPDFRRRVVRFAGFYLGEDPSAPNYDPKHKVIRSVFNGSRGPLLRKATGLDWAGDPIDVEGRFRPLHGERSYREMVEHFKDYNDVVGDNPMNLASTSLAFNAYALTGEAKYREWLLGYVDAWLGRMEANGGIIPSSVGLDGKIGGETDGKWYGSIYGWGFTVIDPVTGKEVHRNQHQLGLTGFGNAYLLTGDDRYLDAWRKQIGLVNSQARVVDGRTLYPHMYGDKGWYHYTPQKYDHGIYELYYWSMRPEDRKRLPGGGWIAFLEGADPDYPERQKLADDFATLRRKVATMRADATTPDTRLADDPMAANPATVDNLVNLALGGLPAGHRGAPLHCRVRYFDPAARRAGLPEEVAALVDRLTADETGLTLVNLDPSDPREVVVQAGGYAEHRFLSVEVGGERTPVDSSHLTVRLAPGSGVRLVLGTKRYANRPTLAQPWKRAGG